MNIAARVKAVVRDIALWLGLGLAILFVALVLIGFAIASCYLWMAHRMVPWLAALSTAGVSLVLIVLLAVIGGLIIRKTRKKQPTMMQEFNNTLGLAARLVTLLVRRDPRKAMIVSLVVGALAELVTSERRK